MKKDYEKTVIKRALAFFWQCEACHKLGWSAECRDKNKCSDRIYKKLEEHFKQE